MSRASLRHGSKPRDPPDRRGEPRRLGHPLDHVSPVVAVGVGHRDGRVVEQRVARAPEPVAELPVLHRGSGSSENPPTSSKADRSTRRFIMGAAATGLGLPGEQQPHPVLVVALGGRPHARRAEPAGERRDPVPLAGGEHPGGPVGWDEAVVVGEQQVAAGRDSGPGVAGPARRAGVRRDLPDATGLGELREHRARPVGGAVVDVDHFCVDAAAAGEHARDAGAQQTRSVPGRHDDADERRVAVLGAGMGGSGLRRGHGHALSLVVGSVGRDAQRPRANSTSVKVRRITFTSSHSDQFSM